MALDVTDQLLSATHSAMAGGNDAKGEIQDSVMSADDFNSITDFGVFWKTARKLGLTVRVKSDDGKGYKRRHKADLVEDYRQQLAELQRSSVSACGFQTQVDVHDSADAEVSVMSAAFAPGHAHVRPCLGHGCPLHVNKIWLQSLSFCS